MRSCSAQMASNSNVAFCEMISWIERAYAW